MPTQIPLQNQTRMTNSRVDLVLMDFEILVEQKGLSISIDTAIMCPCRIKANGQSQPECINCRGSGWFYTGNRKTRGIVTSISFDPKYMEFSELNMGNAYLTVKNEDALRLAWMDRIVVHDSTSIFAQTMYPRMEDFGSGSVLGFLLQYPPVEVLEVFCFKGNLNPLIQLTDADYTVTENRIVFSSALESSFLAGQAANPDKENANISIRYKHRPTYNVAVINKDVRDSRVLAGIGQAAERLDNFPLYCLIKKSHYMHQQTTIIGDTC